MFKKLLVTTCLSVLILGFILFHCKLPEPPPDSEDAKITLLLKSSDGKIDRTGSIQDSVGKEVQIGIVLYLTQYIDSSVVRVISGKDTIRTFPWAFKKNMVDTVFFSVTFIKAGTHKVEVTSYITDQPNSVDEGKIIIYGPEQVNNKPELKVPGAHSIIIGQTVLFSVTALDPDAGQIVTVSASQKPENATFTADTFRWTPGVADTGTVIVVFVATDNGVPVMSDTDTANIFVSATKVNHAPQWNPKSMQRTVKPGAQVSYDLSSICSDPDKDSLTFSLISAPPTKDTIIGSVYSFTPTVVDTGKHNIHILAKDSSGLTDTLFLGLTVSVIDVPDSLPPVIKFQLPSKDTVISDDSFEVKVTCFDDSGCFVNGFRDGTSFTLKKSISVANLWVGIANGIAAGSYTTIKIVATDSSAAMNKDSVSIKIKYDNDKSGPTIILITPTKDSVTTNSSSYPIVLKVTDPSGVLSVNGAARATSILGVRDTGSIWKINVNDLENNKTTAIVLSATDSSLKANKSFDTIYIRSEIVNGYKIKFEKNGSAATGTMADQTINSGDSAKLSVNTFVKDGSTFGGWMTTPAGTTIAYADGAMFKMGTSNIILYAKWIKKTTFALTVTATNGSITKSPSAAVYDSGSTVCLKASANNGYKFVNWSGDATGTTDSTVVVITKGTNVTANFSPIPYTVTFSSQGTNYSTATVNYNALATEPTAPQAGTCYTFGGWYTSETYATKWDFTTDKITGNTFLFAKWTQLTYTVTYSSNGAASGTAPAQQTKTCDIALTLATNSGNLTKTGVTFSGWNTAADGTGTDYAQGASYTANAPLELFAKWKTDSLLVTFNSNSGSTVASKMVPYGGYVTEPAIPTKTGFIFAGWYANQSLTTPFDFSTAITVARTLYAKWNPVYRVVYNANSGIGSVPVDNNEYQNGQLVTLLAKPSGLTRQYYDFIGWNTASNGTGTNRLPGTTFQIGSKNDTLYANWKVALPAITVQPVAVNVYPFDNISFSVTAQGIGLSYLWQKNGIDMPAANSSTFAKQKVTFSDSGFYRCVISNESGNTTSSTVKLNVRTTVKDADSNEYSIVVIGEQIWTVENLRTTKFNDGTDIPLVEDGFAWAQLTTPGYSFYQNSTIPFEQKKWGALYNGHAVGTGKLAPKGWHVPKTADWYALTIYLGGASVAGGKMKEAGTDNWETPNEGATNSSGFSALPGGSRMEDGVFWGMRNGGYWWEFPTDASASDFYSMMYLNSGSAGTSGDSFSKKYGLSVRLVKDQ
jgi:uncharacterized protein (TIGR02145 family)/uncharacterized repeat protein (TIGR02543 family)